MAPDPTPDLLPRLLTPRLLAACQDTPVLLLNGPRQSGKTTLVRDLLGGALPYLTLDDASTLAAARSDPVGFVRALDRAVIDEVQRAPALLLAIKQAVDRDRRPGRFVLTGSADMLALPRVADSLAGRMEVVELLPLAQAEILGQPASRLLEQAFAGELVRPGPALTGDALVQAVLAGGYPEMRRRATPARARAWARAYLDAIVQRDVRDIASLDKLDQLPRLLQALAQHSGQLLNLAQLGGQLGLDSKTVGKYTAVFEQLFLLQRLAPWSHQALQRLVRTPKLHFNDAGLLAALNGLTAPALAADRTRLGPLLESFVFGELRKLISWQEQPLRLSHYRDKDQDEVDFVLENAQGQVVGIEVKAAATVTGRDFKGMRKLAAALGRSFQLGIVLYDGEQPLPFGERLVAAPLACLWSGA